MNFFLFVFYKNYNNNLTNLLKINILTNMINNK